MKPNDLYPCGVGEKVNDCSENESFELDTGRINNIIIKLLVSIPSELKREFPSVLLERNLNMKTVSTDKYIAIFFYSEKDIARIKQAISMWNFPFPGLLADTDNISIAFNIESSRNTYIKNCTIENAYGVKLGIDSTVIIENHFQEINIFNYGTYNYTIDLAYIISFGNYVNKVNVYEELANLISYSIETWRSNNAK